MLKDFQHEGFNLLYQTHDWMKHRSREKEFVREVLENLEYYQQELSDNAITIWKCPIHFGRLWSTAIRSG